MSDTPKPDNSGLPPQEDAREEAGLTWERPKDGSAVYGADDVAPPPPTPAYPPAPEPAWQQPQAPYPGSPLGPARTPEELAQQPHAGAPPYPPQDWQGAPPQPPPQQWAPYWPNDYHGVGYPRPPAEAPLAPPPGYPPSPYGPVSPAPAFSPRHDVASPANSMLPMALWAGAGSLIMGLCCQPIGMVLGAVAMLAAWSVQKRAPEGSDQRRIAGHLILLGIVGIVFSILMFLANMAVLILFPSFAEQFKLPFG
jgi:hypothetical protein